MEKIIDLILKHILQYNGSRFHVNFYSGSSTSRAGDADPFLSSEQAKIGVYFDIKITDETNTKAQKSEYIREAFGAFLELLGNLHHESYIDVQDVSGAACGYGGKTQEYRYPHG